MASLAPASLAPTPTKEEVLQLMIATKDGDVSKVQYLLTNLDIDTKGPSDYPWFERTPLLVAVYNKRQDMVKMLLNKGADLKARDQYLLR
ncbi:ankyrin repeat domain-containing protein 7-like isoform X2 [Dysidea avara]|uniref:ankyrin repeat domain-containing protein 7-like isoform X2 n=1 Tax=Dysidea avara TaxID=196820 RepID=UPI00331ADF14